MMRLLRVAVKGAEGSGKREVRQRFVGQNLQTTEHNMVEKRKPATTIKPIIRAF